MPASNDPALEKGLSVANDAPSSVAPDSGSSIKNRAVADRVISAVEEYDRRWPGRAEDWRPCGVLDLTLGDLRHVAKMLKAPVAP